MHYQITAGTEKTGTRAAVLYCALIVTSAAVTLNGCSSTQETPRVQESSSSGAKTKPITIPKAEPAPEVPRTRDNGADEICEAAARGDFRTVKELLTRGVDPNAAKSDRSTPLMSAGVSGREDIIALLLAKGANVNARTENGHTALMTAVGPEGKLAVTKMLVSAGADIDAQRRDGATALMVAIMSGNFVLAEYLIDKGARSDQTVSPQGGGIFAGWTAADFAEWKGNYALANRLRKAPNREGAPRFDM